MASHMIDSSTNTKAKKPIYHALYFQVLVAIFLGISIGHIFPDFGASLKPLGTAFIKLVKMIIAPIIFLTVVHGIGAMGNNREKLLNVGGKAMLYFLTLSTLALAFGLVAANLIQPGAGMNIDPASLDSSSISSFTKSAGEQKSAVDFLMHIIPSTFISAFTDGEVIQVLFVAVVTGLALSGMGETAKPILGGLDYMLSLIFKVVNLLMKTAPIGAFGAMAFTIGEYGFASLLPLLKLIATFYITAFVFILVVVGSIAKYHGIPLWNFLVYIKAEILLVLGTSSSESALPLLIKKLEKAGCSETSVGLVLPLGYSFNLDGINIYMTLAAIFIAQAMNIDLTLGEQLAILGIAIISSKGAAGVTGAGFVILAATLSSVGTIPVAGMALILGIDRFMSECRAITSFIGNAVISAVIAKSTGEMDYKKFLDTIDPNTSSPDEDVNKEVSSPEIKDKKEDFIVNREKLEKEAIVA